MGVNPDIVGRVYLPSPAYEVGREKIREFAEAINATGPADAVHRDPQAARAMGYQDVIAPPTLAVIIAQRCEAQLITDPEAGIDFSRVVHGEQRDPGIAEALSRFAEVEPLGGDVQQLDLAANRPRQPIRDL